MSATAVCNFCRRSNSDADTLIAGPGVYICDQCVAECSAILAGEPPRTGPHRIKDWTAYDDGDLLAVLPSMAESGSILEQALTDAVRELHSRGLAWARIGEALGMTRQSAWERFAAPI